jgi:signal transduction histidine kinase
MDLHDDVGSSLSQIALRSELALSRLDRGEGDAAAALDQISSNARGLVDAMSDVVWSVDPRHDALSDLVRRIRAFALEAEGSSEIVVRLDLPAPEQDLRLSALLRRQVYLVFKEALNNALRHAGATRVDVRLANNGSELELTVADDGVGFEGDATETTANESSIARGGHGLASMRRRALECGGRLRVDRLSTGGTVVRLVVPLP